MRRRYSYNQRPSSGKRGFLLVLLAGLAAAVFFLQRELRLPPPAAVEVNADRTAIGRKTRIKIVAREPRLGLAQVVVTANGAGFSRKVMAFVTPEHKPGEPPEDVVVSLSLGKENQPEITPGPLALEIAVQARGTKLRQPRPVLVQKTFEVRLDPPALAATSQFVHPAQGGAEAVVYEVGPTSKRDGVQAGSWFFPGYPLPGGTPTQRFALFAVPYDMELDETEVKNQVVLVAEDELGNRATASFIHKLIRRPLRRDVIELKDSLMQKVTSEIYGRTPELKRKGNLLDDYLQLNGELRRKNMAELVALAQKSQGRFLWNETFSPMQNAALKGGFADRRAYMAGGKQVDSQDHLGFDLASFEHAPVLAANAGSVALARYFGIFGNCVVVDHGYGLMSLYAHLSTIGVKEGDAVPRGKELGRSGTTGLAGGDHLHFTIMLHGLPVSPIEWWDAHWIQDRLKLKLGDKLPWKSGR